MIQHKNTNVQTLVKELKKTAIDSKMSFWKRIASDLEKPTRINREVNLYKIEQYCKDGETIVVPGKVLGMGQLTKKVNVVAYKFSDSAIDKINKVGKTRSIQDFMKENIKGKKVRIIG